MVDMKIFCICRQRGLKG